MAGLADIEATRNVAVFIRNNGGASPTLHGSLEGSQPRLIRLRFFAASTTLRTSLLRMRFNEYSFASISLSVNSFAQDKLRNINAARNLE